MLNADVHLLLLRPTRVPIAGEGVSEGFQGQVELDGWTWSFHNEDERKKAEERETHFSRVKDLLDTKGSRAYGWAKKTAEANREFQKTMSANEFDSDEEREKYMNSYFKEAADTERERQKEFDELKARKKLYNADEWAEKQEQELLEKLDRNKNFEFTFSKRVDIATTQLLNSMKAGDVFPTGVMTIHQRSKNASLSLVFNLQRVRLLDYTLRCETSDTLTTMREEWTCEFGALGYVYKNKDMVYWSSSESQNATRVVTQAAGVRAFTMKSTKLKI